MHYWVIAFFLAIVFFTGGSSRSDEPQLLFLGPASLIFCAFALLTLRREHIVINKGLLIGLAIVIAFALGHVIPIPSNLRQIFVFHTHLDFLNDLPGANVGWQPFTPTPANGWIAILTLATPAAIILLGIQLDDDNKYRLLPLLIGLAAVSGLLGLVQSIGSASGPLYLYRVTNNGSAVGLFANRNHSATLLACLFPMLAVYASPTKTRPPEQRGRMLWCALIGIIAVPLILVTGSRSGLIMGIVGLVAAWLLYRHPVSSVAQGRPTSLPKAGSPLWLGLIILVLGFLSVIFSRAEAISRLFGEASGESRGEFALVSADIFADFLPWGSGSGSFVEVYQLAEPRHLLDPSYLNRAHNDWLEVAATFGLPAIFALGTLLLGYVWKVRCLWFNSNQHRRSIYFGRMASIGLGVIALASLSDYPLRTPIMMSVMAVFLLWFMNVQDYRPDGSELGGTFVS